MSNDVFSFSPSDTSWREVTEVALDSFPLTAYKPNYTILNLMGSRPFWLSLWNTFSHYTISKETPPTHTHRVLTVSCLINCSWGVCGSRYQAERKYLSLFTESCWNDKVNGTDELNWLWLWEGNNLWDRDLYRFLEDGTEVVTLIDKPWQRKIWLRKYKGKSYWKSWHFPPGRVLKESLIAERADMKSGNGLLGNYSGD